ncbi:hypothetical protein DFQ26_004028 [Actinomortierella ambigua]|nr:hypothetical protein DFQ26_004028 [Actinomortierella ambigua]
MAQSHSTSLLCGRRLGKKRLDGSWLFRNVDVDLKEGILAITGPSGVGKSTLLKCICQIIPLDEGQLWLRGKTPEELTFPVWRSKVMYVPQRTPVMEGTPMDFLETARSFAVYKKRKDSFDDPAEIALDWKVRPELWHKRWNTLSGGEMQRISIAIAVSFQPEVLLLDEPSSALDDESVHLVENTLLQLNCFWITHSPSQAKRIASSGHLVMRGGDQTQSPLQNVAVDEDQNSGNGSSNSNSNGNGNGNSSSHDNSSGTKRPIRRPQAQNGSGHENS